MQYHFLFIEANDCIDEIQKQLSFTVHKMGGYPRDEKGSPGSHCAWVTDHPEFRNILLSRLHAFGVRAHFDTVHVKPKPSEVDESFIWQRNVVRLTIDASPEKPRIKKARVENDE